MEIDGQDLAVRLAAALRRSGGGFGEVRELERLSAGATKATWAFEAEADGDWQPLILQMSSTGQFRDKNDPSSRLPWLSGGDEFGIMRAAHRAGVTVPQVIHVLAPEDELGEGGITLRIDGETLARRILRDAGMAEARARMTGQLGDIAARIHAMDASEFPFLQRFDAESLLEVYRAVLSSMPDSYPALEFALRWADAHRPLSSGSGVVHGDLRLGNIIVDPTGIRALLDWEIAHVGDPMEDLGYVCLRTWRFGGPGKVAGVGSREELFAAYEAAGGRQVDPAVARFWEVMAGIKWTLGCIRRGDQARRGGWRPMEYAAIGRRVEEPLLDLMDVIEGRD